MTKFFVLAACTLALSACGGSHSSDPEVIPPSSMTRTLSASVVEPGGRTELAIRIHNEVGFPLHDVYFAEHLPRGVTVDSFTATVDGVDVTDQATLETTAEGSVWEGCVTYHVVLQDPRKSGEGVVVTESCTVRLRLRVAEPGLYDLSRNNWMASPGGVGTLFGWGNEPLEIASPNADGVVPLALGVETTVEPLGCGANDCYCQFHALEGGTGRVPAQLLVSMGPAQWSTETLRIGDTIGEAILDVKAAFPFDDEFLTCEGPIIMDLVVKALSSDVEMSCRVASVDESVLTVLRRAGILGPFEDGLGRELATANLRTEGTQAKLLLELGETGLTPGPVTGTPGLRWCIHSALLSRPQSSPLVVTTCYRVQTLQTSSIVHVLPPSGSSVSLFVRNDANADGQIDISDAVVILLHLFHGHGICCQKAADGNDDGHVNVSDALHILSCLFRPGTAAPLPPTSCGIDPTADGLTCSSYSPCIQA